MARLYQVIGAALVFMLEAGQVAAGTTIDVACEAGSGKLSVPDWVCPLLAERMQAAYPDHAVRLVAPGEAADVTLQVLPGRGFSARLMWAGAAAGDPLAGALMGKDMGKAEVGPILDALIAQSPRPSLKD